MAAADVAMATEPPILMSASSDASVSHESWKLVLDAVVPAIVALQVTAVRSFQDDHAGAHGGTGFVVDKELGLLLTNRHVCTCGPARAAATFVGGPAMEEVPVDIAYLDPVHDFAILRFDPSLLQQTPRVQIELDPSECRVGEEIRVVGNDSLEKLQILSGTIARIDRNAPDLAGDYHDENTFYALAASGTRGGSSGSPVLNRNGKAVALNAAAVTGTMHGFYLPLQRVVRALEAVKRGLSVPRGTLCVQMQYTAFPECLRLGVTKDFLQDSVVGRKPVPGGTFTSTSPPSGMLQVRRCITGTAADKVFKPGDILLKLKGEPCADFVLYDAVLDSSVEKDVTLTICRGGKVMELTLRVQDLHSLIPHAFIELGLGVFHEVSYQTAQKHHIPLQGLYIAQAGFVFGETVKSDAVILELNGNPCHTLQQFEELLQQIPEKEYFTVGWMVPKNAKERRPVESLVKMQRQWCTFRSWSLDRKSRTWSPRRLGGVAQLVADDVVMPPEIPIEEAEKKEPQGAEEKEQGPPAKKKARKSVLTGAMAALSKSICSVVFRTVQNFNIDLVADLSNLENDVYTNHGAGIVIDADAGFILTDRSTVQQPLGDIEVTLGDLCRGASVWFMHPNHSCVILKLDPPAQADQAKFGVASTFVDQTLEDGEEFDFVGVDVQGRRFNSQVTVQGVALAAFERHWPPRWHERNLEVINLVEDPPNAKSGVVCNAQGHVFAMYALAPGQEDGEMTTTGYCIPTHAVMPVLEHIKACKTKPPTIPSLEIEFRNAELTKLRRLPAKNRPPAEWLKKLSAAAPGGSASGATALAIGGVTYGGPCHKILAEGDLLVAVDGHVVTTVQAVEEQLMEAVGSAKLSTSSSSSAVPSSSADDQPDKDATVKLTVLRRGKVKEVTVKVPLLAGDGARRVICWHGLVLQETPRSVKEYGVVPASVYISETLLGSPAEADGVEGDFIMAVDGTPTPSLDAILALDRQQLPTHGADSAGGRETAPPRRHLRVETADISGRRFMKALEPDPLFWPTMEISLDSHGAWSCVER